MNTARMVVPTIALGAAAYLASGSDNRPLPAGPAAQLQAPKRGDSINVVRYCIPSSTTTRT